MEEVKKKLNDDKEAELKSQADKLNAKAKRELVRNAFVVCFFNVFFIICFPPEFLPASGTTER